MVHVVLVANANFRGILVMFAYGAVRIMFLGLKFYLKAIFLGLEFARMKFPFLFLGGWGEGKNFQQLPLSLS